MGLNQQTVWTYVVDDAEPEKSHGLDLHSVQYPDGSWEVYHFGMTDDHPDTEWTIEVISGLKDQAFDVDAEYDDAHVRSVVRRYRRFHPASEGVGRYLVTSEAAYLAGECVTRFDYNHEYDNENMIWVTAEHQQTRRDASPPSTHVLTYGYEWNYRPDFLDYVPHVEKIEYPGDRTDTIVKVFATPTLEAYPSPHGYLFTGDQFTWVEVTHAPLIVGKATREVTVRDILGRPWFEETFAYVGTDTWERVHWTAYTYDEQDRPTGSWRNDGAHETIEYDACCGETRTDSAGVATQVERDALGRIASTARTAPGQEPIVTTYNYDTPLQETVSVTADELSLMTTRTFDRLGRVTSTTTGTGDGALKSLYSYSVGGGGGKTVTVYRDYPTSATEGEEGVRDHLTEYYRDGSVKRISGSTTVETRYDYGAADDNQLRAWTEITTGPAESPRVETTYRNMLGGLKRVERPGWIAEGAPPVLATEYHYSGTTGLLERVEQPGQADTLYVYDGLGNLWYTALDVDDDGFDEAGPDRVTRSETTIELDSGQYWQVQRTWVYPFNNDTPVLTSSTRSRLTGFTGSDTAAFVAAETISEDIHGHATTSTVSIERDAATRIETTDVPDSSTDAVRTFIGGRLMSSVSATGVETTYDYDDLGRTIEVTDERGVSTFTGYDTSGRVSWTKDGDDSQTDYVYYTAEEWDEAEPEDQPYIHPGRLKYTENPTNKKTRFGYDDHGRTVRTWGDAAYPTENVFDAFGQRTALRTFRGGSGWDGAEWPGGTTGDADETTWAYDDATGLLNTKEYADATEVNYTYTEEGELYTRQWARHAATDVTTYGYDGATGELLSVTYDESFNMTNVAYTYDRLGRQATVTDAAGLRTFAYDAATLELVSETFTSGMFNGLVIKPDYEDGTGGTLEGRWSGLRVGTSGDDDSHYLAHYGYDAAGRLNRVTGPGLPAGSGASHGALYTFVSNSDLVDQVRYKMDGGDVRAWVDRSYEAERDQLTSVENNFGDLTTYTTVSKYAYGNDALARRTHAVRTGAAFGGTGGSGDHLDQWSYNNRNELTGSDRYADTDPETPEDPVAALDRAYAYDSIGNRVTSEDGATPTEWEYDTNALNQYERVDTVGAALIRQGYTFDADGNLAEQWLIGDATCDGLVNSFDTDWFVAAILDPENNEMPEGYPGDQECWDRRLEWADVDGNGAINSFDVDPYVDVLVSGSAVARVFTWNAENKLVMASPVQTEEIEPALGSQRVNFVYDYMGRRIEKLVETWTDDDPDEWVETSRIRYVYDGWLLLEELDAMDSNAVVRQYTWGLDLAGLNGSIGDRTSAGGIGGLLAVHDETVNSGEDYIYLYDANGNVGQLVALEDDYGDATDDDWHADRLVARYEYDAYGRITGPDTDDDGDWRDDGGAYATTNVMRFSTKPWDDELGWGNWGERLYEPRIGRWTSRDPIEERGGTHLYRFCVNRPFLIDGRGEFIVLIPVVVGVATETCVTIVGGTVVVCEVVESLLDEEKPELVFPPLPDSQYDAKGVDQSPRCRQLYRNYKAACKNIPRCRPAMPCDELVEIMKRLHRCLIRRLAHINGCVKPEYRHDGHVEQIENKRNQLHSCSDIFEDKKCNWPEDEPDVRNILDAPVPQGRPWFKPDPGKCIKLAL